MRFQFGANWSRFVETSLSERKVEQSLAHLKSFLRTDDLRGKSFLDIGSGSGLHSLSAYRLGADRIFSFDYDPMSVETTRKLRDYAGKPDNWLVEQGSVLEQPYMAKLDKFDIVYSWGVLHHTGDMWSAIRNAMIPLKPDGVLYIALYAPEIYVSPPSHHWLHVKRQYNSASKLRKRRMEFSYAWHNAIRPALKQSRNPLSVIRQYGDRGMSYWTDVRDWLGGYPMDFAGFKDTVLFCKQHANLDLVNCTTGEGNTEFLFANLSENQHWRDIEAERAHVNLESRFELGERYQYAVDLSHLSHAADTSSAPKRSRLMLYEDGIPLGLAHSTHDHIRTYGLGRFSHWDDRLYFSASDCTNPNFNGRSYSYVADY
jgi:SAM-dependent methyltransferase